MIRLGQATLVGWLLVGCGANPTTASAEWKELFDGKTLNGWVQLNGTALYAVADGCIVGTTVPGSPNSFLCTTRDFTNFVLELEFKVDEGLNSGVQIRSQSRADFKEGRVHGYQVEIDPAQKSLYSKQPPNLRATGEVVPTGTEPRNWTGGIFDESRRGWLCNLTQNEPARKAFRPGQWNHFRIEAIGDSIRTRLNGVPAASLNDSMTPSGFIGLQVHSTKAEAPMQVRWKNIRILELDHPIPADQRAFPISASAPPPGALVLFDGGHFDHWTRQKPKEWEQADGPVDTWKLVEGQAMEVVPGTGSIITREKFGDCRLHLEFRTLGPVNSGVYLQTRYEISLKDSHGQTSGSACGAPGNFSGTEPLPDIPNAALPPMEWQTLDVEFRAPRFDADGSEKLENARITATLNGVKLYENFEITAVKGAARRFGETTRAPLMLQEHGAPIQFRNIWILEPTD